MKCPDCFSSNTSYSHNEDGDGETVYFCEDCYECFTEEQSEKYCEPEDDYEDHDIDPAFDPATGLLLDHPIFQE